MEYEVLSGEGFSLMNAAVTVLSIVAGAVGFTIKRIFSKLDENSTRVNTIEEEVSDLKVKIVENHPSRTDFENFKRDLTTMLIQLVSPINSKLENIETFLRTSALKRKDD